MKVADNKYSVFKTLSYLFSGLLCYLGNRMDVTEVK